MLRTSSLVGWASKGSMISCWFFKGSCFVLTFVLYYFLFSFCFVGCVLFSKIELFVVWVCLATFWCFIVSFLDLVKE